MRGDPNEFREIMALFLRCLEVGPNFFKTLRILFLSGRGFTASDFELTAANHGAVLTIAPTPLIVMQAFAEI